MGYVYKKMAEHYRAMQRRERLLNRELTHEVIRVRFPHMVFPDAEGQPHEQQPQVAQAPRDAATATGTAAASDASTVAGQE